MNDSETCLIQYEELTYEELSKLCAEDRIILLSLGSIEQHGPHLPVGTDYLCSRERTYEIAAKTGNILFAPLMPGYSPQHKSFFGTISLSFDTMKAVLCDIMSSLAEQGWKRFLFFSGHASNWPVIECVIMQVKETYNDLSIINANCIFQNDSKDNRFYKRFDWHAGVAETAILNYYFPHLLRKNNIPPINLKIPKKILKILSKDRLDIYDKIILKSFIPQNSREISDSGVWTNREVQEYKNIPVEMAMHNYIDFFVNLIDRWDEYAK